MPPHKTYIEPFLGSGAVMRHKRPAWENIGIDLDNSALINFKTFCKIPNIQLYNVCSIDWLKNKVFDGKVLIYLDPPYLLETRRRKDPIYEHELTQKDHEDLLMILLDLNCMVIVSGYYSILYDSALSDWQSKSFLAVTRGNSLATEYLWFNFPIPDKLHDYSFLGDDYIERQRIKRKIARWSKKLKHLPATERNAILSAITDPNKEP